MAAQNDPGARSPRQATNEIEFFPRRSIGQDGMRLDVPAVTILPAGSAVIASIPVPENCALHVSSVHYVAADSADNVDALATFSAVCIRVDDDEPEGEETLATTVKTGGILADGAGTTLAIVAGGPTGWLLNILQAGESSEGASMRVQARFVVGALAL